MVTAAVMAIAVNFGAMASPLAGGALRARAVTPDGTVETEVSLSMTSKGEIEDNIISGSAPLEITFTAFPPEQAIYDLWEVATDEDFQNVELRYNESAFTRVFNEYGKFYVRYYCADESGAEEWWGITYVVDVFESKLLCPNAFTPYGSPGVNDEWKVVASSIVEFDCVIFNRWGNEVAHLTSVDQGWDGRYKGRLVSPGVYFYVIKARGADGRAYNLSGDINLIKKGQIFNSGTTDTPDYVE